MHLRSSRPATADHSERSILDVPPSPGGSDPDTGTYSLNIR